jgi:hypothetical protein
MTDASHMSSDMDEKRNKGAEKLCRNSRRIAALARWAKKHAPSKVVPDKDKEK